MSEIMDELYETSNDKVALVTTIYNHKVVFREIWFTVLEPHHVCAYVRLTPPFKFPDDHNYEYCYETYRDGDVFGIDTDHHFNINQNITQRLKDAKQQITQLIQEHIDWQSEQSITYKRESIKPKPVHERIKRFLNLEL